MHNSEIPIWFFIGVLLVIYGSMIFGYGIYELASGNYPPLVQLIHLHTPIWWGGLMAVLGVFYVVHFFPRRTGK